MMAIGPPLGVHPGAQIKGIAVWRSARVFAPCMLAVRVRVSLSPLLLFLRPPRPSERVVATLDLSALLCSAAVATPVACARKLFLPRASVPFRSPVVASPPRRPGPPARPAPHVAHQPDPNAATATRGAVGSRSRSVAACPQHTTTANKARPKPTGLAAAAADADAGQEEYHSGAIRAGPENWSGRSISALCWLATGTERQGRDGCCRPSATATVVRLWAGAARAAFSFGNFVDFYLYI